VLDTEAVPLASQLAHVARRLVVGHHESTRPYIDTVDSPSHSHPREQEIGLLAEVDLMTAWRVIGQEVGVVLHDMSGP
jgi:hypothetical protein